MKPIWRFTGRHRLLEEDQIADLRLAVFRLKGAERRGFMAQMMLKYYGGRTRLSEAVFGWGRETVEVGLAEKRAGIVCVGAQACCGGKRWEEQYPVAAGRRAWAAGLDFSHVVGLHAVDGRGGEWDARDGRRSSVSPALTPPQW